MTNGAGAGKVLTSDAGGVGTWTTPSNQYPVSTATKILSMEFMHLNIVGDYYPLAVGTGTKATLAALASHPGVLQLRGSADANSGYSFMTGVNSIILAGGEHYECVFAPVDASSENRGKLGFTAKDDATALPQGAYLRINGLTMAGVCCDGAGNTVSGTNYTYTAGLWYRAVVDVAASAASVTFTLYLCTTGASLWTQTVTTNIPDAAGEEVGSGIVWYQSSTTQRICYADWMSTYVNRTLVR
jgi:hypothetical protein